MGARLGYFFQVYLSLTDKIHFSHLIITFKTDCHIFFQYARILLFVGQVICERQFFSQKKFETCAVKIIFADHCLFYRHCLTKSLQIHAQ